MANHVGKKFVLLSPEVYEALIQKSSNVKNILAPPEKAALNEVDNNMKTIWQKDDIPDDEKIKLYTKDLNSLQRFRDSIKKPEVALALNERHNDEGHKLETSIEKGENEYTPSNKSHGESKVEDIIHTLPKNVRKDAAQILRFIKSNPNKMTWNNEKELVYQGSVLHGSNIGDLLLDTLSNRKKTISPNLFRNAFSKGLNDITIPKEWIKNEKMKDLMEYQNKENITSSHKRSRSTPYPLEIRKSKNLTLKTPTKWLSSTSKIR